MNGSYSTPQRHEVLILGDDHLAAFGRNLPDFLVRRPFHAEIGDMHGFMPRRLKITRKRRRQLRIDEKTHGQPALISR